MNQGDSKKSNWDKLVRVAKQVPKQMEAEIPPAFERRVVARWLASESPSIAELWRRLTWRALGLAGLVTLLSVIVRVGDVRNVETQETVLADNIIQEALKP